MTEKRKYENPSIEVFELKHRTQLLQVSGQVNATMNRVWVEETVNE